MSQSFAIGAVFFVYLAGMIAVGVFFFRRTESLSDYFLGDRKLNKWITALSAQASDMSGWLLMGLPGAAYVTGLASGWTALGLAVGTYLNWRFVARRLRRYTEIAGNAITLSDYLENRFRDTTRTLRIVSALCILVFFLVYTSAQFVAAGKLFASVFGVPYVPAVIIGALVIVSYTFLGGFNAVCWTDFFQGTLMFFAILTVPIVSVVVEGGFGAAIERIHYTDPQLLRLLETPPGAGALAAGIAVVSAVAWGLGYFGQPHILVRFMAIRSADEIRPARRIAMVWVVLSLIGAVAVGFFAHAYTPLTLDPALAETVFIEMASRMFPSLIAGVLLAAILAATMSTADSQLLVATSAITEDFYKGLIRPNARDNELVWVGRLTVILVTACAVYIASDPESSVFGLVAFAWAGFGAAFGPVILLSLFWPRMTRTGAVAGMITGGLTVVIWKNLAGGIFDLYEIVPAFLFACGAIAIRSLLSPAPGAEMQEEFERAAGDEGLADQSAVQCLVSGSAPEETPRR